MSQFPGHFYLHKNGDLIYKPLFTTSVADLNESPFVKKFWRIEEGDEKEGREVAWTIVLEALASGALLSRIKVLAEKWGLTAEDLCIYLPRVSKPTPLQQDGLYLFIEKVLGVDPDTWLDWLEKTPNGEGPDFSTIPKAEDEAVVD